MAVKTATRPASHTKHRRSAAAAALIQSAHDVIQLPFGSLALGPGAKPGRGRTRGIKPTNHAQQLAQDFRMAMIGHAFLMGTLQLLAQLMASTSPAAHSGTGKQRAPWGSKTGRRQKRRAK